MLCYANGCGRKLQVRAILFVEDGRSEVRARQRACAFENDPGPFTFQKILATHETKHGQIAPPLYS